MRLSRQFQTSLFIYLFIYFYEEILSVQKGKSNQNQPTKTQTSEQKTTKATIFSAWKLLRGENWVFCALMLFVPSKSFCKKKNGLKLSW